MNISERLEYFFEALISEKNFSLNSIDAYKRDLMQLFNNNINISERISATAPRRDGVKSLLFTLSF